MSQLEQFPAGALVRSRPWDVIGAALAAPMLLWGFLSWFGVSGDSAGGTSGYFSGAGAAALALSLVATAITVNELLAGRPHQRSAPPLPALLAAAAVLLVLGAMIAKPDSATIAAGAVAGLLTAISQAVALTVGWIQGSEKAVKAANVRAFDAQQAAADAAASYPGYGGYPGSAGYPNYGNPSYRPGAYPVRPGYPAQGYPAQGYPTQGYPTQGNPAQGYPGQGYPAQPAPSGTPGPYGGGPYPGGTGGGREQPPGYPYR